MQLDRFNKNIHKTLLDVAWAHWIRLGVFGTGGANRCSQDIEAAVVLAAYAIWLDDRLLDGVVSWLSRYHELVNAERLKHLVNGFDDAFAGRCVAALIESIQGERILPRWKPFLAGLHERFGKKAVIPVLQTERHIAKWVAKDKVFTRWGLSHETVVPTMKLKDHLTVVRENRLLGLRCLFGISARADVLYVLAARRSMQRDGLMTSQIAKLLGYSPSSIFRILCDFENGGFVEPGTAAGAKKNRRWRCTDAVGDVTSCKAEQCVVDWKRVVALLIRAAVLVEELSHMKGDTVAKHALHTFEKDCFSVVSDTHLITVPHPSVPPLERYTADEIARRIESCMTRLARAITGQE